MITVKIDHVGYLTGNIEKAISEFILLGYHQVSDIIVDDIEYEGRPSRNVKLCFLENDEVRIELVAPINEASDVYATLKRQGEGPYHVCYQVEKLEEAIIDMKKSGWVVIREPQMAVAFNYKKVVFLYKRNVGTTELVEVGE